MHKMVAEKGIDMPLLACKYEGMTYDEVMAHFGTQVKLAAALGITQSTVSSWGRVVPRSYQYQIEVITDRKLLADAELRLPADRVLPMQAANAISRRQMS
jgi:transcriptional repressor of cell division inhibition gene dicB